jgi:hypothetical protein
MRTDSSQRHNGPQAHSMLTFCQSCCPGHWAARTVDYGLKATWKVGDLLRAAALLDCQRGRQRSLARSEFC